MSIYVVNDCEDATGVYFTSLRNAAKYIWDNIYSNGCVITREFSCESCDAFYRKLLKTKLSTYKYVDYDSNKSKSSSSYDNDDFGTFQFEICKAIKGGGE
jgi:hypothetical protein